VKGRVHSFDGLNADNLGPEPRRRIWAQRLLMPTVQRLVARSDAMRQSMCTQLGIDPSRVQLIADGMDLERYDRPVDRDAVRGRWGLTQEDFVVGIVARLDPVKDHRTLIRAASHAAQAVPTLKLLVVGGGPLEDELRREVAQSPMASRVIFTGAQIDVPPLYHAMDLYAQPSLYEGVSGSMLEAMAARLPVLSTAVGGTVDIVLEGTNGHLVAVGDDAALGDRIVSLAKNRNVLRTMGSKARIFVEEKYSLAQVVARYGQVYREACGWEAAA